MTTSIVVRDLDWALIVQADDLSHFSKNGNKKEFQSSLKDMRLNLALRLNKTF